MESTTAFDVIVIGGGAAGLFCASEAGKRGRRALVLEHSERVGKKISISGGGRCNFTNINANADSFLSTNPHFAKSALARYTAQDFVTLVERHHIAYHEKKLGQLFCDGSSAEIIQMLLDECAKANVEIRCNSSVQSINKNGIFKLSTTEGHLTASSVVIATGGLSIPTLGATDFGYRIARQFELKIEVPRPGLVPFKLNSKLQQHFATLSGVSIDALVTLDSTTFRENVLLTHRGLSGPAILQISSYWKPHDRITINLLPELDASELLREHQPSDIELVNVLSRHLPKRFAQVWCNLYVPSKPMKQFTVQELDRIGKELNRMAVVPAGTEGFKKAEVTAGGVSTDELSSKTMESKRVPGLYFIGEVVDVTGHLGGYNFQWAWSSGFAAGQYV
ncbi:MAG: aminoacetone oxidase family FAD-binding enzyme [Blastocatellia bacterium]|nr:MAG: aminoacetone oxidase family FAD-binding enzyme [Blastocatellia bacterium]